jgi:FMN-dependent oxidoreductase (nitrilotriacetate monooxygenase family)
MERVVVSKRRMKLVAYMKTGPTASHAGGWRHPAAALHDIFDPRRYEQLARTLEEAKFDAGFFADTFGLPDVYGGTFRTYIQRGGQISYLDPMLVLPLMARVTTHLGLGATLSTTFHPPYLLARMLASLDILTQGRAAWNVVTSATDMEARNFGMDSLPAKALRYDQADEVLEACNALWECWDDDALVLDRESGVFADPEKIRYADYEGKYVRTRGPLAMPRSPQTRPVFLQAGSSDRGRTFAARWAEMIFASGGGGIEENVAFTQDIKSRMAAFNRPPEHCAVCKSLGVVIGETEAIAQEKADALDALADADLVLAHNSTMLGADLAKHQTPDEVAAVQGGAGITGIEDTMKQRAAKEGISYAQAVRRPRKVMVGTAQSVADQMQAVFEAGGCDGFAVWPTVSPTMFEEFGRLVVPELQRRGLVQKEYGPGATLRDRLRA